MPHPSHTFPAYHNQPFALTIAEIDNPQQVINSFFGGWRLTEVRYLMKEWLVEANSRRLGDEDFLHLHDEMMRLCEAVWVQQQDKSGGRSKQKKGKKGKK